MTFSRTKAFRPLMTETTPTRVVTPMMIAPQSVRADGPERFADELPEIHVSSGAGPRPSSASPA